MSDHEPPSPGRNGIVLLVIVVALVGGWFLVRGLVANARLEDCLMSGRRNCAPIDAAAGQVMPPH
jgi:hypothetical protein